MKNLSKVDLLIQDEFLLTTTSECERNDLFEVIQSRTDKKEYIKIDRDKSTFKSHRDFDSEIEMTFKHF